MTEAQKAAKYDQLVELLRERIELEMHYREKNTDFGTIQTVLSPL